MLTLQELQIKTGKRVICIDASASKTSSCLLRTWYTVVDGYRSSINSNDIEYGSAFHLFVKEMKRSGGNFHTALRSARAYFTSTPMRVKDKKTYLNVDHLSFTCLNYWEKKGSIDSQETLIVPQATCSECHGHGRLSNDPAVETSIECLRCKGTGKYAEPLVEQKFSLPYYEDNKLIILLTGTIDDIAKIPNGCYVVRDYKTTSVWNKVDYLSGYALSCQLKFYKFILHRYAKLYPDSIFATIVKGQVGCMVRGIFLSSSKDTTYEDSEVFQFTQQDMDEFEILLQSMVDKLVNLLHTGMTPLREGSFNGACDTPYGKCNFFNVCTACDDIARKHVLRNNFIQKQYDPLKF